MKQPTHYLIYTAFYNAPKNKLEAALQKYLEEISNTLIDANDLPKLKSLITRRVDALNVEHHRCRPFSCEFWKTYEEKLKIKRLCHTEFLILPIYGKLPLSIIP